MRVERISNERFRADGLILSFTITRTRGCISLSLWTHIFRFFEESHRFQRRITIRWFDESERLLKETSWKENTLRRRDLFRYIAIILLLQRTHHLEDQYLSRFAELDLLGLAVITSFDFRTLSRFFFHPDRLDLRCYRFFRNKFFLRRRRREVEVEVDVSSKLWDWKGGDDE